MAGPIDVIKAFHNAFREDIAVIDAAAVAVARGRTDARAQLERFRFFNEVLAWHARGEEVAIFPALDTVAPLVSEAYEQDHRGLDAAYTTLEAAVSSHDALETARATAAFKFHLDLHLAKEDTHVYRLIRERVSVEDQSKAVGMMAGIAPPERFADVVAWLFPLLGPEDTENTIRMWQMMMPAPVFATAKPLIRSAVGDRWSELDQRIPGLTDD